MMNSISQEDIRGVEVEYSLGENPDSNNYIFKIDNGLYSGMMFTVSKLSVSDEQEGDVVMKIDYDVESPPTNMSLEDMDYEYTNKLVAFVVQDILMENISE